MPQGIVFSLHKYIEYQQGDSQVILTIPHGGHLKPAHLPNRDAGALVDGDVLYTHAKGVKKDPLNYPVRSKGDTHTEELGLFVADELQQLTGLRPHVVICHLHRSKLDVNSGLEKAAFGLPEAEDAWHAWHGYINSAKAVVQRQHGRGLLVDIHGHVHSEDWVELGYTLSPGQLNSGNFTAMDASIAGLLQANKLTLPEQVRELLSGQTSLGGLLEARHIKAVPSPSFPSPGEGSYYTGGFNTTQHGSAKRGGLVDAIQIENPKSLRNSKTVPTYGKALAGALAEFVSRYYKGSDNCVKGP